MCLSIQRYKLLRLNPIKLMKILLLVGILVLGDVSLV